MPLNPILPPPRRATFQTFRDPVEAILHARDADELRLWYGDWAQGQSRTGKTVWTHKTTGQRRYQEKEPGTGRRGKQKAGEGADRPEAAPEGGQKPQKPAGGKRPAKAPAVDHEAVGDRIQAMLETGDFTDDDVAELKQALQGVTRPQLAALRERFADLGVKAGRSNQQGADNLAGGVAGRRKQQPVAQRQAPRKPPISIGPEDVEGIVGPDREPRKQTLADEVQKQKDKKATERAANVEKYREQAERGERLFEDTPQKPQKKTPQPKLAKQPRPKRQASPPLAEPEEEGLLVVPEFEDDGGIPQEQADLTGQRMPSGWQARAQEPQPRPEQVSQVARLIAGAARGQYVVNIAELRQQMPDGMQGRVFDEAVLSLADSGQGYVSQDAHRDRFSDEELGNYVQDGEGFLTTFSLNEDAASEPQRAEIGAPASEVPGSPVQQAPRLPEPPAQQSLLRPLGQMTPDEMRRHLDTLPAPVRSQQLQAWHNETLGGSQDRRRDQRSRDKKSNEQLKQIAESHQREFDEGRSRFNDSTAEVPPLDTLSVPGAVSEKLTEEGERAAWFVEDALAQGDMTVDELRKRMPPNEVRDALDSAVAHLEASGKVRRGPDGRLSFAGDKGTAKLPEATLRAERAAQQPRATPGPAAPQRRTGRPSAQTRKNLTAGVRNAALPVGRQRVGRGGARLNARSPVGILLNARNVNATRPLLYAWVRRRSRSGGTVWVDPVTGERRYQDNQPGQRPGRHLPMRSVGPEEHLRRVLEAPYDVAEEHLAHLQERLRRLKPAALHALEMLFPGED